MRAPLISLLAAVRLYAPLIVLLSLTLLIGRNSGGGVGLVAGLVFALALAAHALVFGADEARRAFPPMAARVILAISVIVILAGAGAEGLPFAAQASEVGLFLATSASVHLVFIVLIGRAPTLREMDSS